MSVTRVSGLSSWGDQHRWRAFPPLSRSSRLDSRHVGREASLGALALAAVTASLLSARLAGAIGFHAPTMRATIETVVALCALGATALFAFSFVHSRRLLDLLLFTGMLAAGVDAVLSYGGLPVAAPLVGALLVSVMLAVGALAGTDRRVTGGRRTMAAAVVGAIVGAALAELGGFWFSRRLLATDPRALGHGALHPLAVGVLAFGSAAFVVVATIRIARRSRTGGADARLFLTGAFLLLSAATLQYLALPSLAPNLIAPRDGLRLLAYALILTAGLRQEAAIRHATTYDVALRERRRMADDLHDGLAQDLAFIAAHGAALDAEPDEGRPLELAARRALAVSRDAIHNLSKVDERAA